MSTERRPRLRAPAEVALFLVTVAALVGLHPLFDTWSYLPRVLVAAAAAHLTVAAARAAGIRLPVAAAISATGLVLTTTWLFAASTTWYGVPTGASWQAVSHDLADGWQTFQEVVAPAEPTTGFLLATALAVWLVAFVGDWAAFRLWAPFEAIVPSAGLVVFAAVLGTEDHAAVGAIVYLAAALVFLLVHRAYRQEATVRWVSTGTGRGTRALLVTGGVLATAALVAGVALAPRLPGADQAGLISLDGRGGDGGPRVTLSPLVDIRARLIDQRRTEVFTVRSAVPAYWRMTSLDRFDGQIWSSGGTYEEADGELPNGIAPARASDQVEQEFTIEALSAIWLPAAYEPSSIDPGQLELRWEPASSTLIVDQARPTSDGTRYRVVSSIPRLTPDELRGASEAPTDLLEHYTKLPAGFSETARARAEQVVADAATDYDRALALQQFFREGFEYSTDVPAGHGESAIDAFLARRVGFCEQFAGTFAAMARHLGIPSRVAVGFTTGEQDASDPSLYHVRGLHAHAWPEIWLGQYGWVPMEPTKSRGAPNAEAWTGLAPRQADEPPRSATSTTTASSSTTSADGAPSTTALDTDAGQDLPLPRPAGDDLAPTSGLGSTAVNVVAVLAVLAAIAAAWVAALHVLSARIRRRDELLDSPGTDGPSDGPAGVRRARRVAGTPGPRPDLRVRRAWSEALDHLAIVGGTPVPSETHAEFAAREASSLPQSGNLLIDLARTTDLATFAPGYVDEDLAAGATEAAHAVVREVTAAMTPAQRLLQLVDPRPVWRRWRRG
ncbi:MAG: transglutaminase domain-containing protein [Acidimicrobiales bacterium]|nr:transglutaminase domain-containing protein [Acidimicrobiales bacterium]